VEGKVGSDIMEANITKITRKAIIGSKRNNN
jgi:hypothetical protein